MEAFTQISLGTAALLIFAVCAAYMLIRGLLRTIINLSILATSSWVGFQAWQNAPTLAFQWTQQTSPFITTGLPVLAFLLSFLLLRKILRFFFAPIATQPEEHDEPDPPRSILWRLFVTFTLASVLCLIAAVVLHHITSVSEIREHAKQDGTTRTAPDFASRLKTSLSNTIPESLMEKLDPLASQPRIQLAKLIATHSQNPHQPEIDPQTGEPVPRALIVDKPELISLAKEGRFSTLLRHPLLSEALNDPRVRKALGMDQPAPEKSF